MIENDRKYFYKYVSSNVAKLIVENQKLKWSCPESFNDPFDHKFNFLDIDFDSFNDKFLRNLEKTIFESDDDIDTSTENGQIIFETRQNRDNIPRDKFKKILDEISKNFTKSGKEASAIIENKIKEFLAKSRVLCLTEKNDNLLMWSHCGPSHTGAVLRLDVVDGMDINLSLAKKFEYTKPFPSLATEEEWMESFLCKSNIDPGERYYKAICTKSDEWSYEDEWRLSLYQDINEPYGDSYIIYPKEAFGAIYLGLKMSFDDKQELTMLSEKYLPKMEIWKYGNMEIWKYGNMGIKNSEK